MRHLNVYSGTTLVGRLTDQSDGSLAFSYAKNWIESDNAISISPALAISDREYRGIEVISFFENLLPEGDVRNFIAKAKHISPENTFAFLELLGGETGGMFSILPEGQFPCEKPHYLSVTSQNIKDWFKKSHGIPLDIRGEQARMSLSGAQDKMTVYIDTSGAIMLPLGAAPSSHIIKPSVSHRGDIPNTAINEAFVMTLARAVQLDVPDVKYAADLDAAVIARYDRVMDSNGALQRLHQNDLCQIMNIPSGKKYEQEGGPTLSECFNTVMKYSYQPILDKKRLIEWVIFNILAGNMDSHAKNLSIITTKRGMKLAPFYDIVCTWAYPTLSHRFAFKIGGENRPEWMMPRHWDKFASDIKVSPRFLASLRDNMIDRITKSLPIVTHQISEQAATQENLDMIQVVAKHINRELIRMKSRKVGNAIPDEKDEHIEPENTYQGLSPT